MRSRKAEFAVASTAWIALGATGFLLLQTELQPSRHRAELRGFDQRADELVATLADVRTGQQAYLATGEGGAAWIPKVAAMLQAADERITSLRAATPSVNARASLDDAADAVTKITALDKRARDYLRGGQPLMAGDVIFTEGRETVEKALTEVQHARLVAHQAFDGAEAGAHEQEAIALGAAGTLAALVVLLLALGRPDQSQPASGAMTVIPRVEEVHSPATESLVGVTGLCVDLGRARNLNDIAPLLARVAADLDATGLMVWMAEPDGTALRPMLAHGYDAGIIARMPSVPKTAPNAVAAAFRSGTPQVVSRRGTSAGAIVAPVLSGFGPAGVLSVEIRDGHETSARIQALASIFAACLTVVLSSERAVATPATGERLEPSAAVAP